MSLQEDYVAYSQGFKRWGAEEALALVRRHVDIPVEVHQQVLAAFPNPVAGRNYERFMDDYQENLAAFREDPFWAWNQKHRAEAQRLFPVGTRACYEISGTVVKAECYVFAYDEDRGRLVCGLVDSPTRFVSAGPRKGEAYASNIDVRVIDYGEAVGAARPDGLALGMKLTPL